MPSVRSEFRNFLYDCWYNQRIWNTSFRRIQRFTIH